MFTLLSIKSRNGLSLLLAFFIKRRMRQTLQLQASLCQHHVAMPTTLLYDLLSGTVGF